MPALQCLSSETLDHLARIVESDFLEMPGMRLTRAQVQRLWNLSADDCARVLDHLMHAGRLARDAAGQYCVPGAS